MTEKPDNALEDLRRRNAALEKKQAFYTRRESLYNALRSLHEEIWKMQGIGDIQKVLNVLQKALKDLRIDYWFCSVNVVDDQCDPPAKPPHNHQINLGDSSISA